MNLLYVSNLTDNMWRGPTYSVPAQIAAQSKIDNVFWYNLNNNRLKKWEETGVFYNLSDYPRKSLSNLPKPFSHPDLVIFEGVYEFPFSKIGYEVQKQEIPYILVPRSQLTELAQHNKRIKKSIGNILYFNRFIRNAVSIQYLTQEESNDSGNKWNDSHFIIPNGIQNKDIISKNYIKENLTGVYIGRVDIYQKGLDMLLKASKEVKRELLKNNCTIDIYGPDRNNSKEKLEKMIHSYKLKDIIKIHDGVFGEEKEIIQRNADFFVMTSRFEGHPMGLIEALSYGLPSLVTTGTNMANEIKRLDAGWTSEPTVEGIKTSILRMLMEKKSFEEKSINAVKLSAAYNWDELAGISHDIYLKLLENLKVK